MARRRFLYQGDPPAIVLRDERAATCADEDAERRSEKEYGHRRRSFFPREIVRDLRMSRRQANRLAYAHTHSCQPELRKIVRETACASGEGPDNRTERNQSNAAFALVHACIDLAPGAVHPCKRKPDKPN